MITLPGWVWLATSFLSPSLASLWSGAATIATQEPTPDDTLSPTVRAGVYLGTTVVLFVGAAFVLAALVSATSYIISRYLGGKRR